MTPLGACSVAYPTGAEDEYKACTNPATIIRYAGVAGLAVEVRLCGAHNELWDLTADEKPSTVEA